MQLCVSIVSFGPNCLIHFLVEQTRTLTQRSTRERKDKRSPAVHRKNQAMSKVCLIVLHWWFSCTASTKLLVDTGCMAVAYVICRSHWVFSHSCNTFFFAGYPPNYGVPDLASLIGMAQGSFDIAWASLFQVSGISPMQKRNRFRCAISQVLFSKPNLEYDLYMVHKHD